MSPLNHSIKILSNELRKSKKKYTIYKRRILEKSKKKTKKEDFKSKWNNSFFIYIYSRNINIMKCFYILYQNWISKITLILMTKLVIQVNLLQSDKIVWILTRCNLGIELKNNFGAYGQRRSNTNIFILLDEWSEWKLKISDLRRCSIINALMHL